MTTARKNALMKTMSMNAIRMKNAFEDVTFIATTLRDVVKSAHSRHHKLRLEHVASTPLHRGFRHHTAH